MLARLRPYLLLFLGLNVVYHANLRPVDSGDSLGPSLIPLAIVLDHGITLDRFVPWLRGNVWYTPMVVRESHGHFYSTYPIGGALLVSPLYLPLAFLVRHWDPGALVALARIAGKVAASAVTALSAVFLLVLLKRITTTSWAWCLTLVYALATETWSISSQSLWQHGPGELAIIGCFFCLERWSAKPWRQRWLWLCGSCAAAAFVIRPTNLVLLPAALVALLVARAAPRQYLRLLAVPLLGGALLIAYNWQVFHRLSGGYAAAVLNGSVVTGLLGLFLSPGRGLLIYTPVAIFALCAFLPRASESRHRHNLLLVTAAVFIVLESIVVARSISWWGGYCWGPRMLTELVPPLVILMALGASIMNRRWLRGAFVALALYSMLIQAIGVFCYPKGHWDATPRSVDIAPARLWEWRDNPVARTVAGGLYWEPYAIAGAVFTGGISAAQQRMRELNVNPYEQARPNKLPRANPGLP